MRRGFHRWLFLMPVLVLFGIGCGGDNSPGATEQEYHLHKLGFLYGEYSRAHIGPKGPTPPPSMEALKTFARSKPKLLESRGIELSELDDLFVSPRDGKEYVLRKKPVGAVPGKVGTAVVIYEAEGKDGERLVMFEEARTEKVDEARFRELVPERK